jgi:hypothetical protein
VEIITVEVSQVFGSLLDIGADQDIAYGNISVQVTGLKQVHVAWIMDQSIIIMDDGRGMKRPIMPSINALTRLPG